MLEAYAETIGNAVQQVGCIILVRMVNEPQLPCIIIKGSCTCCEVGGGGGGRGGLWLSCWARVSRSAV